MILAVALGAMTLIATVSAQAQSLIYGLTTNNSLVAFSTSGAVVSGPALTGLGVGEAGVAIDFRPFTGDLYLLTRDGANVGRLYTVNTVSGAATSVALSGAALNLTGNIGMDFNPAASAGVNALRIVTGSEQNYRITFAALPATVVVDSSINPTNTPLGTNITAVAYVNNRTGLPGGGGTSGTTLYAIDSDTDSIYVVNPPNNGTLVAGQPLGININAVGGFDIATLNDRALGLFDVGGVTGLYEVNLTNGAAFLLRSGGGLNDVIDLAITLPVQFPPTLVYAATTGNALVSFSTDSTNVSSALAVTGLGGGESIVGIDFRPLDGKLYALTRDAGNIGRLYTVDLFSGAATAVSLSGTLTLTGAVGMDFDPVAGTGVNALRIVTGDEHNYRITFSGASGTVNTDLALNATGAAGTNVVAAAYTNNRGGLPGAGGIGGTTLYVLDADVDVLYVQNLPDNGTLTAPRSLGIDIGPASGLDIVDIVAGRIDRALALLDVAGDKGLYEIDLNSGLANLVRDLPETFVDLAVPVPATPTSVSNITTGTNLVLNFAGGVGPFNVQRANIINDPWCSVTTVASGPVALLKDGPQAFLRVRDLANAQNTRFTASLSGAAAGTASTGFGFATVEMNGNTLTYDLAYTGLSGAPNAAHVHLPAPTTGAAGVAFGLTPVGSLGTTGRYAATVQLSLADKTAILAGLAYFNIHTGTFGNGEIRGQIVPAASKFILTGVGERPNANTSPAFGAGALSIIGNRLAFDLTFQGLVANSSLAHFHGPANSGGVAAPIIDIGTGAFGALGSKAGTLTGVVTLTPAQLAAFADGNVYVNVHSGTFPGGEIRGQVSPYIGELPFSADLTGAAEKPLAVSSPGSGFVESSLAGNVLSFVLTYRGMTSAITAAHIHGPIASTNTAGILFDLAPYHRGPYSTQGVFSGSIALTPAQIGALGSGDLYMNLHTAVNPSGEIRGQLAPMVLDVVMNGANERPVVATGGTGKGYVGLVGKQVLLGLHYRDLAGDINNAHYHGPADTSISAVVLVPVNFTQVPANRSGFIFDARTLSDAHVAHFADSLVYVNIHSGFASGGEIRGQVVP
jgi:hypothetical protein